MIGARSRVIFATGSRLGEILFFESVEHDHLVPITIGGLVKATQETISAPHRHGFTEHAAVIRRATAQFVAGRSLVEVGTLRRWWALFDHAWDLLANSPIDDPCIADETAEIAASYIYCELVALGINPSQDDVNTVPTWSITYAGLNADLNNAYEANVSKSCWWSSEISATPRLGHWRSRPDSH